MADDYILRVLGRSERLERFGIACRQDIMRTQQEMIRSRVDLEVEMEALKREIVQLEIEVQRTMQRVKYAVGLFRNVAKKGDLSRLQQRVDYWAPEKRITRKQFLDLLAELRDENIVEAEAENLQTI
jgi:predicted  nucleic acid-binding Zn-ribbon protein